jgi:hypothetical protein
MREVLLSNPQSDLAPLEIGLHVLKVAGKGKAGRGNRNGVAEYARQMGVSQQVLSNWVLAAEVAKTTKHFVDLVAYTTCLAIIHRTPESDWVDLVARMLSGHWTYDQRRATSM